MARVLLLGPFGLGDPGGEATCTALCRSMHDHEVVVASARPSSTAAAHGCAAIPASTRSVIGALRTVDAVVIGDGTLTSARSSTNEPWSAMSPAATAGVVAAARIRSIPVVLVGTGASELRGSTTRALSRWIISHVDLLVLRDEESAAVLSAAGVPSPFWIGADPVWTTIGDLEVQRSPLRRRRATVILPSPTTDGVGHGAGDAPIDRLWDALGVLRGAGWVVRMQTWPSRTDVDDRRAPAGATSWRDGADRIAPPRDVRDVARGFADDDLVISTRPHAIIAAAATGCRIIALGEDPRLTGLARRLDQVSVPEHASAAVLSSALRWAIDHDPPSSSTVDGEIDLADRTLRLLRLLLEGGRLERPHELAALQLSDGAGRW